MENINQNENNNSSGRDLLIGALCCFIIGNLLLFTSAAIFAGIVLIAGFVVSMLAVNKNPKSLLAKILIILYFVEYLIVIIFVIYMISTCMSCLNGDCSGLS